MPTPAAIVASRYRLLARLGAGALGEVWAARDEKTEREVALKVLVPSWALTQKSTEAFLTAAKTSAKIRHPSVVALLDIGETKLESKKIAYVVMELLEAEKLEVLLDRVKTLPSGTALRLASELAWALQAAHDKGLFHERLEPANVLLHRDVKGEVVPKIVDFGVVRLVDDLDVLPGTPHEALSPLEYLSPEQIHADVEVDGRADVYALAALLHRMLVGEPPFAGKDAEAILESIEAGPQKLLPFEPPLDDKVVQLVTDGLQRNRRLRPTMRVFAERIDALRERFEPQWKALGEKLVIPEDKTLEALAELRGSRVAKIAGVTLAADTKSDPEGDPVSEKEVEEVPPASQRLSASELEELPPSIPNGVLPPVALKAAKDAHPPPLPPPSRTQEAIKDRFGKTSDPLSLEVLADLEKELLKHVAAQRASDPGAAAQPAEETPPPPSGGIFKGKTSVPPASALWSNPPPGLDAAFADAPESEKKAGAKSASIKPAAATVAVVDAPKKSSSALLLLGIAAVIVIAALAWPRGDETPTTPAAASSAAATPAPTPAPTPTPTIAAVPTPAESASTAVTAIATGAPTVTAPVAPTVTGAPTVTAAPTPTAPPVATIAPTPTYVPTATATAAPKPTAAAPKPTATEAPTAPPPPKPSDGLDNAGF